MLAVHDVIRALLELRGHLRGDGVLVHLLVPLRRGTRDEQRVAPLVDEDGIDLVDNRKVEPAAHDQLVRLVGHVIPQVIEANLGVGDVGYVRVVRLLPLLRLHVRLDDAHGEPERSVHAAHPLGVAPREVIVHGDDVHPFTRERVKVRGQRRRQRLALARGHLADAPVVQQRAADELDVEVPHVELTPGALADHREGLDEQIVQGLALLEPIAEFVRLGGELRAGQRAHGVLEPVRGDDNLAHLLIDDAIGALGYGVGEVARELDRVLDDVPDVRQRSPRLGEVRELVLGRRGAVHRGSRGGGRRRPRRDPTIGRSGSLRTAHAVSRSELAATGAPSPRQPRGRPDSHRGRRRHPLPTPRERGVSECEASRFSSWLKKSGRPGGWCCSAGILTQGSLSQMSESTANHQLSFF